MKWDLMHGSKPCEHIYNYLNMMIGILKHPLEHVALWFFHFNYFLLLSITFGVFFALHHYRHLDLCTFLGTKYFQILFGLTKHTHTIYLPSLLRLGMVAFVIRMFVRAAARCVRTSCTQNLTDIRNQFSARIFFIHRLKVLFTVVQWNFASLDLSYSLGRKLYYAFISCFIGIYWKRHVHHLPVSVDILYTIQSRVSRSVGWLIGNVIAFLLLLLELLPSIIEYGCRDEQIPIHTFYVPSMRALDFFFCHFSKSLFFIKMHIKINIPSVRISIFFSTFQWNANGR